MLAVFARCTCQDRQSSGYHRILGKAPRTCLTLVARPVADVSLAVEIFSSSAQVPDEIPNLCKSNSSIAAFESWRYRRRLGLRTGIENQLVRQAATRFGRCFFTPISDGQNRF